MLSGRERLVGGGLALVLVVGALGCSGAVLRRSAIASEQFAMALEGAQGTIAAHHAAGVLTTADYQAWQRAFAALAEHGLAVNAALRAGRPADAASQIHAAIGLLDELLKDAGRLPEGQRVAVLVGVSSTRALLVAWAIALE